MNIRAKEEFHQDTMGNWFRDLAPEKKIRVPIALFRNGQNTPEWYDYNHRNFDGIGALIHLLEQNGFELAGDAASSKAVALKGFRRWRSILKFFIDSSRKNKLFNASPWREINEEQYDEQEGCGIAWCRFSVTATQALLNHSKRKSVSLNSFLLHSLNESIPKNQLKTPEQSTHWRIPVNLRGKLHLPSIYSNHSTWLDACLSPDSSLEDTHKCVRKEIDHGMPWLHYQLATFLWNRGIKIDLEDQPHHCGAFSNLGIWPEKKNVTIKSQHNSDIQNILFVPPMHQGSFISAGVITFNSQLSLAMQIHPALANTQEAVKNSLRLWVEELLTQSGQSIEESTIGFTPKELFQKAKKVEMPPTRVDSLED